MCINSDGWIEDKTLLWGLIKYNKDSNGPVYGDICTIENGYWKEGVYYYNLIEWPDSDPSHGYESSQFIPIQGEETQIEEVRISKLKEV